MNEQHYDPNNFNYTPKEALALLGIEIASEVDISSVKTTPIVKNNGFACHINFVINNASPDPQVFTFENRKLQSNTVTDTQKEKATEFLRQIGE